MPKFSFPKGLKKVLSGSQKPTLFLGANEAAKSSDIDVRFGISDSVKMSVGKSDVDFDVQFFLSMQKEGVAIKAALLKDKWNDAMGVKKLDLANLMTQIGVSATGSVSFALRGSMDLDGKDNTLEIAAAINAETGLPDPRELLFYLKTRELGLEQYMKVVDIFIGHMGDSNPIATLARGQRGSTTACRWTSCRRSP